MNCNDVLARAWDYFERELAPADRAAVEAHVAGCATCSEVWAKAREMSCRDFAGGCGELVDGTVAAERRRVFERHLSICKACAEYLATYERTIELARASARLDDTELVALEDRLVASILAARQRRV